MAVDLKQLADLRAVELHWASLKLRDFSSQSRNTNTTSEEFVAIVRSLVSRTDLVVELLETDRCFETHLWGQPEPTIDGLLQHIGGETAFFAVVESIIEAERGTELSASQTSSIDRRILTAINVLRRDSARALLLVNHPAMLRIAHSLADGRTEFGPGHPQKPMAEAVADLESNGALSPVLDHLVASECVRSTARRIAGPPGARSALALATNVLSVPLVQHLGERDDVDAWATSLESAHIESGGNDPGLGTERAGTEVLAAAILVCLAALGSAVEVAIAAIRVFATALTIDESDPGSQAAIEDRIAKSWNVFYRYAAPPHGIVATPPRAKNTLDSLFAFLESWYGPRRPEYGIDDEVLATIEMPEPLRRLHRFAGAWPNPHHERRGIFSAQDNLWNPAAYEPDRWGEIIFAEENQGVFVVRTPASAQHPGAEGQEEDFDPSLEDWLVRFCVRETVWNGPWSERQVIEDDLVQRIAASEPFIDACYFPGSEPLPVWLIDDRVLVMRFGPSESSHYYFAAKNESVIDALLKQYDLTRYSHLAVSFGGTHRNTRQWQIMILPDGSCHISSETFSSAQGAFDFENLSDRLDTAIERPDGDVWSVGGQRFVHPTLTRFQGRTGRSDNCLPVTLREVALTGIAAIVDANPEWVPPWGSAMPQLVAPENRVAAITIEFGNSSTPGRPIRWSLIVEANGSGRLASSASQADDECARLPPGSIPIDDLRERIAISVEQAPDDAIREDQHRVVLHTWPPIFPEPPRDFYRELLKDMLGVVERGEYFDVVLEEYPPAILNG